MEKERRQEEKFEVKRIKMKSLGKIGEVMRMKLLNGEHRFVQGCLEDYPGMTSRGNGIKLRGKIEIRSN